MIEPTGEVVPVASIHEEGEDHYHRAEIRFPIEPAVLDERGMAKNSHGLMDRVEQWPETCDSCDHVFTDEAWRSARAGRRWRWVNNPGVVHDNPRDFGPGAMWDAHWMPFHQGPDGRCLVVICPGGDEWMIDGRANNCTRPDEKHQCWVREGEPPNITITKGKPGESCAAGAGSIQTSNYHGFLRNGQFT